VLWFVTARDGIKTPSTFNNKAKNKTLNIKDQDNNPPDKCTRQDTMSSKTQDKKPALRHSQNKAKLQIFTAVTLNRSHNHTSQGLNCTKLHHLGRSIFTFIS